MPKQQPRSPVKESRSRECRLRIRGEKIRTRLADRVRCIEPANVTTLISVAYYSLVETLILCANKPMFFFTSIASRRACCNLVRNIYPFPAKVARFSVSIMNLEEIFDLAENLSGEGIEPM